MTNFEERARRSARAARQSFDAVEVPDLSGIGGGPRRGRVVAIGLAFCGVAAAVVLTVNALGHDSSPAEVAGEDEQPATPPNPVHLVWADPDPGMALLTAIDLPFDIGGEPLVAPLAQTLLFGLTDESDPFADRDLIVATFLTDVDTQANFDGDPISVRGKPGVVDSSLAVAGIENQIGWHETESLAVLMASRSLDIDQLLAVAETMSFDGHLVSLDPPGDLERLAEAGTLPIGASLYYEEGSVVSYASDDQDSIAVVLSAPGAPDAVLMARYLARRAEPISVRGRQGWLLSGGPAASAYGGDSVVWLHDGQVSTVAVSPGLDAAAIADALVEINQDEWDQLVLVTEAKNREVDGEQELIAEGQFETDGVSVKWRLALGENGLCLALVSGRTGSSGCGPTTPDLVHFSSESGPIETEIIRAYGFLSDAVARVALEGTEVRDVAIFSLSTRPGRVFGFAELARGEELELAGYGADGSELWRRSLTESMFPDPENAPSTSSEVARGTESGVDWAIRVEGTVVCLDVGTANSDSGTCGDSRIQSIPVDESYAVGGLVPSCVQAVYLSHRERSAVVTVPLTSSEYGSALFALVDADPGLTIEFVDADGDALATALRVDADLVEIRC